MSRCLVVLLASSLLLAACSPARSPASGTETGPAPTAVQAMTKPAPPAVSATAVASDALKNNSAQVATGQSASGSAGLSAGAAPAGAAPADARAAERAAAPAAPAVTGPGVAAAPAAPALPRPAPTGGPAPAPTATGSGPAPQLPQLAPANRMIVYNTELTLLVKSVNDSVGAVSEIATSQGGYVAGVENSTDAGLPISTIRIKVQPDRYQAAMAQLRALALEVQGEKATTQDVTEEYNDVQTQLASLQATHQQLLDLLSKASTMDEVLKIQTQANQIKLQIDRLRGRATVLERLSDLASITVRVQSAESALGKDYAAVRGQLRQAQTSQASQLLALKRARTPEEEAGLRDKLGELALQIDRTQARLKEIEQKASQAGLALPTLPNDDATQSVPADDQLQQRYITSRVQLRQAEARQADLTHRLKGALPADEAGALREQLTNTVLEINRLTGQLKTIQERATQTGLVLPSLTADQEAALAGTTVETPQPDPFRAAAAAWEASLGFLRAALAGLFGAVVFIWWAIPLAALLVWLGRGYVARHGWPSRRPAPPTALIEEPTT